VTAHNIYLARVYDPPAATMGARLLADRLWPRGLAKADLGLAGWLKQAAPSNGLRRWLHADPGNWDAFVMRYGTELDAAPMAVENCLDWCRRGPVTLLTAARDPEHSHVSVLRDYLAGRLASKV
jgi:uncharacterized protein YeaO (DUF488 family)